MKSLVIGRFQPFHNGHEAIVDKLLDEGKEPVIAIRDTSFSDKNPFSAYERTQMIKNVFGDQVQVIVIPDIEEVVYGRKPGWSIREIELGEEVQQISATAIRKPKIIWLTGNSRAGKTTLADNLLKIYPAIKLDGDEMRDSISTDKGFSLQDRLDHNLRVARLARLLREQGYNVVVSVIAPTQKIRAAVSKECAPLWVYVKRDSVPYDSERPYEVPDFYDFIVDNDSSTPEGAAQELRDYLAKGR